MEISENASQISSDFVAAFERARPAEETFKRLADQWHSECLLSSSVTEICTNMAYQQIIGLGAEAPPFIFREVSERAGPLVLCFRRLPAKTLFQKRGGRLEGNGERLARMGAT